MSACRTWVCNGGSAIHGSLSKGSLACIYTSLGENHRKFQTARLKSATGYWTWHLPSTNLSAEPLSHWRGADKHGIWIWRHVQCPCGSTNRFSIDFMNIQSLNNKLHFVKFQWQIFILNECNKIFRFMNFRTYCF